MRDEKNQTALPSSLQPTAREAGPPQTGDDVRTAPHEGPDRPGAVVLGHEHHWSLVDAELVGRHPPPGRAVVYAERLGERTPEAVRPILSAQLHARQAAGGRDDDPRDEGQRGDHDPRGDGAVVRAERGAAGDV